MWSRTKSSDAVLQKKKTDSLFHCTDQSKEGTAQPSQKVPKMLDKILSPFIRETMSIIQAERNVYKKLLPCLL